MPDYSNSFQNVMIHESSYVDEGVTIGENTKIWHFSHILENTNIGMNCSIGQNVVIGPNVEVGNKVKVQNNDSIYSGVICEDDVFQVRSMVFTNIVNHRSAVIRRDKYGDTIVE